MRVHIYTRIYTRIYARIYTRTRIWDRGLGPQACAWAATCLRHRVVTADRPPFHTGTGVAHTWAHTLHTSVHLVPGPLLHCTLCNHFAFRSEVPSPPWITRSRSQVCVTVQRGESEHFSMRHAGGPPFKEGRALILRIQALGPKYIFIHLSHTLAHRRPTLSGAGMELHAPELIRCVASLKPMQPSRGIPLAPVGACYCAFSMPA